MRRLAAFVAGVALVTVPASCASRAEEAEPPRQRPAQPAEAPRPKVVTRLVEQDGRRLSVSVENRSPRVIAYNPAEFAIRQKSAPGEVIINDPRFRTLSLLYQYPGGRRRAGYLLPKGLAPGRYVLLYPFEEGNPLAEVPFTLRG